MIRAIIVLCGICLLAAGCTQRTICPAYQSAFIYDKDQLRKKFSYFLGDSTPKVLVASKNKYLVATPMSYQKKVRTLQTVEMKKVFVEVPDSISGEQSDSVVTAELDQAARSVIDSTYIVDVPKKDSVKALDDSVYVISKDREVRILRYNAPDSLDYDSINQKYVVQTPEYYVDEVGFNTEQDNYMWYLRRSLVLPDVRLGQMQGSGEGAGGKGKKAKEKKGLKGFFKNLFKKKKKEEIDSTQLEQQVKPPEDDFDYIDTTATDDPEVVQTQSEKKGLLSKKKKQAGGSTGVDPAAEEPKKKRRKKKSDKKQPEPAKPEDKKDDADDGF